ncbi:Cell shape-determining protein [Desulfonema limicola]|uniref:Cell shape-determining protein MreB n=1 Tax=Desulfonema limicola TaxID=45656 RepID=A0A975B5Z3_9BACT|nr:Cell shape-determining protein [Desulfonema limicola]
MNAQKKIIKFAHQELVLSKKVKQLRILCPNCKAAYKIDASKIPDAGARTHCVKCKTNFSIKKKLKLQKNIEPVKQFKCRSCGRTINRIAPSGEVIRSIICKECEKKPEVFKMLYNPELYETDTQKEKIQTSYVRPGINKKSPGIFQSFLGIFSNDLAIDLGTANTLVYIKRRGIVLNEASVVALRTDMNNGQSVLAVGAEAKQMMGKTPANVSAVRPMRKGVIADFEVAGAMLKQFIQKVRKPVSFIKPRMIIAIPSEITPVERRAVKDSAEQAGARDVYLIDEPMAAAIGASLPVTEATCNMIVDIGGGTTEVAVISLSGIVAGKSIRIAGDEMDTAIIKYIKKEYNFIIGESTAEEIKKTIGNACPDPENIETIEVKGWEIITGKPRIFSISSKEVKEAISDQLHAIVEAIKIVLDNTPQELAASAVETGLVLAGGVALLKNLDKFIIQETGLPVIVADDPLTTIVNGCGKTMDDKRLFNKIINKML